MKNALILHGTAGSSKGNWFPWLKERLDEDGYKVWVPDLPDADFPNIKKYNQFLLDSDWEFNGESIIVGHSSGSVAILGLLGALPNEVVIDTAILVGAFRDDLGRNDLQALFKESFDFEKIKKHARQFVFLHGADDPICPLAGAQYLSEKLNGELIVVSDGKHFSGPQFKELPQVLQILNDKK